ncbi:MAG: sodium transporter, partial [Acidiferrobacterales bacterium]
MIDVVIVMTFVAYAIGSGLRSSKIASQNLEEYFLAGRSLKGWQAGVSMAATQFAADTPLLVTGLVAMGGIFALWRLWVFALAFLLLGFVLSSSWRRVNVLTDAELTEIRYGARPAAVLRGMKAIYFGTIINCTVLALVLLAATRIAEPFLLWEQWLPGWMFDPVVRLVQWVGEPLVPTTNVDGSPYILNTITWKLVPLADSPQVWLLSARNLISIVAILAVTTFYSTTGGLRSVVRTDIVQFAIMMVGTLLFATI